MELLKVKVPVIVAPLLAKAPTLAAVKLRVLRVVRVASVTCPKRSVVTLKSISEITVAPVKVPVSKLISSLL